MEVSGRKKESSLDKGIQSQSQFNFYCQPCDANYDVHREAEGYCQTCKEYLCETCFKHHRTPTAMKHHVLRDKEQMPRASLPFKSKSAVVCTELCHAHAGETIKYFCVVHNQLGCSECQRLSHNGCKGVLYIPEVAHEAKNAQEYKQLKRAFDDFLHSIEQMKKDTEESMVQAKTSEDDVLMEIDNFQEKANLFFARLTDTMKKEVKAKKNQTDSALQKRCTAVVDMLDRTKQWTSDLATKHHLESKGDLFIAVKNGEKELQAMTEEMERWKQTDRYHNFVFKPNEEIVNLMSCQMDLGSLVELQESKAISVSGEEYNSVASHSSLSDEEEMLMERFKMLWQSLQSGSAKVATIAPQVKETSRGKERCVICMNELENPKTLKCGHKFCTECKDQHFKTCPTCGAIFGVVTGDQPDGEMEIMHVKPSLAGHSGVGTIVVSYTFKDGRQGPDNPRPGSFYSGTSRTAYLPDTEEGRKVCAMLKLAFKRRLIFTIGRSRTIHQVAVIIWNDIHHKTDLRPNSKFGYPDPSYLDRVKDELAAKGITEANIDQRFLKKLTPGGKYKFLTKTVKN